MRMPELLRRRTPLGWLQLKRERARLIAAIAGISFADLLMFLQLGVISSFYSTTVQFHQMLNADVVLLSPQARDIMNSGTIPRARLYQAMGSREVTAGDAVYLNFLDWKNPNNGKRGSMILIGVDPHGYALLPQSIRQQLSKLKMPDSALFDRSTRGSQSALLAVLNRGGHVSAEIQRRTVLLVGSFQAGATFGSDGTLIASSDTFLHLFGTRAAGSITFGLLRLRPGTDTLAFARSLSRRLPADTQALTKDEFIQFAKDWQTQNAPIAFIFIAGTAIGFVIGVAMVYQILSSDVLDHTVEYATFKAMGYTNRFLGGVIFEESLILAVVGYGPGFFCGVTVYSILRAMTALPVHMTWWRGVWVFLLTLGLCIISGVLAARKVRKADPAEVFA